MEEAQYEAVFADLLEEFVPSHGLEFARYGYDSPQDSHEEGIGSTDTASAASLDDDDWQRSSAHVTQPQSPEAFSAHQHAGSAGLLQQDLMNTLSRWVFPSLLSTLFLDILPCLMPDVLARHGLGWMARRRALPTIYLPSAFSEAHAPPC